MALMAHQRRLIRRRDQRHRTRKAGLPEIVLQEFLHLAAMLADQRDDGDVAGDTDAGIGEYAHALGAADGNESIERKHTEIERLVGRKLPAAVETAARQPRRTPSRAANGMASAWPLENSTTSLGIPAPMRV
jgi:hypothetical protein